MWYKVGTETIQPPSKADSPEDYSTDPSQINNSPVALNVSSDVLQKANTFVEYGKPIFFTAEDGQKYLIIHGTPNGYFNTGEPGVNSDDNDPDNDGFVD